MARAVRFDSYGGVDVLKVLDVEGPPAGPGELPVEVRAGGATVAGVAGDRNHGWLAAHGVKTEASSAAAVAELPDLVDRGEPEIPIARTYPLEQVQDALRELEQGHTRGKIALVT